MTEAETLELISMYYGNAIDAFALYITFTFAYLTVAYFVGRALTRFQVFAASGLYLVSTLSTALGVILPMVAWTELLGSRQTLLGKFRIWNGEFFMWYLGAIFTIGIIVSLYFMFNVRTRLSTDQSDSIGSYSNEPG